MNNFSLLICGKGQNSVLGFFPEGKMKHELPEWLAEMLPNTRQVCDKA